MSPDSQLTNRIAEFREKKGLTQRELARLLGCSKRSLIRWELGYIDPSLRCALQLSDILGKTVKELFHNIVTSPA